MIAMYVENIKGVDERRLPDRRLKQEALYAYSVSFPHWFHHALNATRPHDFNTNRARLVFHREYVTVVADSTTLPQGIGGHFSTSLALPITATLCA